MERKGRRFVKISAVLNGQSILTDKGRKKLQQQQKKRSSPSPLLHTSLSRALCIISRLIFRLTNFRGLRAILRWIPEIKRAIAK